MRQLKKKDTQRISRNNRIRSKLSVSAMLLLVAFMIFYVFRLAIYNSLLDSEYVSTKATIINNKNILGKVHIDPEFTYSYEFYVNENSYTGNSRDTKYSIGNRITIEYWPHWPFVNRPKQIK
jgi:hypothetical protein